MPGEPAAFMSYARFNDEHDDGQLTRFRQRLAAEVRAQTGQQFTIFQDREDIAWGQNWKQRIDDTLDTVPLLLVIVTPGFFASEPCRDELTRFLERERTLGRADLILPVYYISAREIDNPAAREADELAAALAARQLADWRELRFKPLTSPSVRKAIAHLAGRMRDAFWQPSETSATQRAQSAAGRVNDAGRLRGQKNYADAENAYREAIRLNPANADAHCGLGVVLYDTGRHAEAEAAWREAIRLNPANVDAHNRLGGVLHDALRYAEAEAAWREAIRLNPANADAHNNLGVVLHDTRRDPEAEAAWREAIRLNPAHSWAYNNLGVLLHGTDRYAEAEAAYREAIRLDPAYARPRENLAALVKQRKPRDTV